LIWTDSIPNNLHLDLDFKCLQESEMGRLIVCSGPIKHQHCFFLNFIHSNKIMKMNLFEWHIQRTSSDFQENVCLIQQQPYRINNLHKHRLFLVDFLSEFEGKWLPSGLDFSWKSKEMGQWWMNWSFEYSSLFIPRNICLKIDLDIYWFMGFSVSTL